MHIGLKCTSKCTTYGSFFMYSQTKGGLGLEVFPGTRICVVINGSGPVGG